MLTSKWRDWIKVYTQNIHIGSNTARQIARRWPTASEIILWSRLSQWLFWISRYVEYLIRRVNKINDKSFTLYKSGNYYNRLIFDILIAKNSGSVFWDTVYTISFIILVQTRLRRNSAIVKPRRNLKISQQQNHL